MIDGRLLNVVLVVSGCGLNFGYQRRNRVVQILVEYLCPGLQQKMGAAQGGLTPDFLALSEA